jgi:hypothetical protein
MKICYYAIDKGGNKEETKCGKLLFTIPPAVDIESPEDNYITSKLHITVNATHDAENASDPLITTFNGEDFVAVAAQMIDNKIYGVLTYLFPGPNRVSARIKNGAGIFGEDTINVYYDHTGPSIEMTSDTAIEYNEPFLLSADIADEEWTAIRTEDDIGEVIEAYVSVQSSNLNKLYNMTKQGKQWSAYVVPTKDNLGFADYLPGTYSVTFNAKDSFGNENTEQFTIEIFDTVPANITVELSTPNLPQPAYRERNVFYTSDRMPTILVTTTEPADCKLRINSAQPALTVDFVSSDSLNHLYASTDNLNFAQGIKQTFSAQILCRDMFAEEAQDTNIVINYDDRAPDVLVYSDFGINKVHKKEPTYLLSEPDNQGNLLATIAVEEESGEGLRCELNCTKSGSNCGNHHTTSILPLLGTDTFEQRQEEIFNYDLETDQNGEYNYLLTCYDKAYNKGIKEFTIYVDAEHTIPLTTSATVPATEPGMNLQSLDIGSPVIADINAKTIYDKLGIIVDNQRENYKKFIIVDGTVSGGNVPLQLIADVSEKAVCRYSTTVQNFNQMQNKFLSYDYVSYPRAPFLNLADGQSYTYYVGCRDEAGNLAAPYTLDIEVNMQEPVKIYDAEPIGNTNKLPIVNAYTYRNVQCTYAYGTKTDLPMRTIKTENGYLHTSAQFSGNVLFVPQETDTAVTIECGQGSGLQTATKIINFAVDTTNPNIVVDSPLQGEDVLSVTTDLIGTTEPESEIDVYVNNVYHKTIRTDDGSFAETTFLENDGHNQINLYVRDKAGNKAAKSLIVNAAGPNLKVSQIIPVSGRIGDITSIIAVIEGDDFHEELSSLIVYNNDVQVSGDVSFTRATGLWEFFPDQGYLSDGEYFVEVLPVADTGESGFGKQAEFVVDQSAPKINWVLPDKDKTVFNNRMIRPVIELGTISSTAPVTDATIYVQNRVDDALGFASTKYNLVRTDDDQFTSKLYLNEGINYLKIIANNLYGETEFVRGIFVDTSGPMADIDPKGTITYTRPQITANFNEDVRLKYYDLIERGSILQNLTRGMIVKKETLREFVFDVGAQLRSGTYLFTIGVEDKQDNTEESQQEFIVNIGEVDLTLFNPEYGVSPDYTFNLEFRTNQDANCRYSRIYEPGVHTSIYTFSGMFEETGQNRHRIFDFELLDADYPDFETIYVWCESVLTKTVSQPEAYDLSVDGTEPELLDYYAEPAPVAEQPLQTTLYIETDDETKCKFECNSGVVNYHSMENIFSDEFSTTHSIEMNVLDKTYYECNIACMNRAELISSTELIEFQVDTDLGAGLRVISPEHDSAYPPGPVELEIRSQNLAQCSYDLDGEGAIEFPAIARKFNTTFEDLDIGEHSLEIGCVYSAGSDLITSTFYIDDTEPDYVFIGDGEFACDSTLVNVTWEAEDEESGITLYEYAVRSELAEDYDVRNFTQTTATNIDDPLVDLEPGRYYFAVRAMNRAGLWSEIVESDGVMIDSELNICAEEMPPLVQLQISEEAGKTTVTLVCTDNEIGCNPVMYYGTALYEGECDPTELYNDTVDLYETQQFCYLAEDMAGNEVSGEETITVLPSELLGCEGDLDCDEVLNEEDDDVDGDGILNCDDDDDDGDNIIDYDLATNFNTDFDDDNDGINDDIDYHINNDLDLDGLMNGVDDDDDCDAIIDCDDPDRDNDGIINSEDVDDDNDGVRDIDDTDAGASMTPDNDNDLDDDGIPNSIDGDIDGDEILNEDDADMDNDGVPDCVDQDNDNDGVLDKEDSDYSDDFDEDGMSNLWEEQYGLNKVNAADAGMDNDKDGLTNLDEFKHKTNPLEPDTDGDGHTDYDELFKYDEKYDPNDAESKPPSKILFYLVLLVILILIAFIGYYGYTVLYVKHKEAAEVKKAAERRRLREEAMRKARPRPALRARERSAMEKQVPVKAPPVVPKKVSALEKKILEMRKLREQRRVERENIRKQLFGKFESQGAGVRKTVAEQKLKQKAKPAAKPITKPDVKLQKTELKKAKVAPEFAKLDKLLGRGKKIETIAAKTKDMGMPKKKVGKLADLIEKKRGKRARNHFDRLMELKKKR